MTTAARLGGPLSFWRSTFFAPKNRSDRSSLIILLALRQQKRGLVGWRAALLLSWAQASSLFSLGILVRGFRNFGQRWRARREWTAAAAEARVRADPGDAKCLIRQPTRPEASATASLSPTSSARCCLLPFPSSSSVGSAVWLPSLSSKVACSQSIGWFLARTMRQALFVELTEWTVL